MISNEKPNQCEPLDDLIAKWDKACKEGFGAKPFIAPTEQSADIDPAPTNGADDKYWNTMRVLAERLGKTPNSLQEGVEEYGKRVRKKSVNEATKDQMGDVAGTVGQAANPIRPNTTGPDQNVDKQAMGGTYTPEVLDQMADLSTKLHDLRAKLSAAEGEGKTGGNLKSQIDSLKKRLDDLSDSIGQFEFPD